jgi:multicomponent Na+:H+ antiporter subunit E
VSAEPHHATPNHDASGGRSPARASSPVMWGLLAAATLAAFWLLFTEGDAASWVVGAPTVTLATAAAVWLRPPVGGRPRLVGLARFVVYFIRRSLVGGADVAWRALHPALPLTPAFRTHRFRLPAEGPSRVFYACVLNLLPGTLGAELHDDQVTVHVLDSRPQAEPGLSELEEVIAVLFGLNLPPAPDRP